MLLGQSSPFHSYFSAVHNLPEYPRSARMVGVSTTTYRNLLFIDPDEIPHGLIRIKTVQFIP